MRKTVLLLAACVALSLFAPHAHAAPEDPAKAGRLLDDAAWHLEMKDPAKARELILEALAEARHDAGVRRRAGELWSQTGQAARAPADATAAKEKEEAEQANALKKQQHLAQLEEAERQAAMGEREKAAAEALAVLKETTEKEVTDRASAILKENSVFGSAAWQRLFTILYWALNIVFVILALVAIYLLLKAWRHVLSRWKNFSWWQVKGAAFRRTRSAPFMEALRALESERRHLRRWVVSEISDAGSTGAAAAVTDSLSRWKDYRAPASAGLLRLEMLQFPSAPLIEQPQVQVDLAPALEQLPLTIGGVDVGAVAKAVAPLRAWLGAKRLWIRGAVYTSESSVRVSLTRRNADDTTNTVTASAAKEQAHEAAEAASYMMYYLIATDSSPTDADAANKLKEGLALLGKYVSGREPGQLEAAYEALRNARNDNPSLSEAYLYEGIALDLMERHDEAIQRFEYVAETASSETLRAKANYNVAVSLFRKYRPDELDRAIAILGDLTGLAGDWDATAEGTAAGLGEMVKSPLKALALAARANAVAHKPIFWRDYTGTPPGPDNTTVKALAEVESWVNYVETVSAHLRRVLQESANQSDKWDPHTRQQLNWSVQNARGNIRLYVARNFYAGRQLTGEDAARRETFLVEAQEAFHECEMFLPPGVETLTNLATVMIELRRYHESRAYAERAIKLNPNYEYAYYRLAEAWERDSRVDEVVEVLKRFAKERTPGIPSFRELYRKYSVELARGWAEATPPAAAAAAPPAP